MNECELSSASWILQVVVKWVKSVVGINVIVIGSLHSCCHCV